MNQNPIIELKEDYLLVEGQGSRSSFEAVLEGTLKINEAAEKHNIDFILADYRKVIYSVPLADAFNLVRVYEKKLPIFSKVIISAVINEENLEIAKFWESICLRRGFHYKVFTNYKEAESWLFRLIEEKRIP